ncbi:MAG: DivIVA domain-containing protein [Lachnospiraceae bacterium]|nr:DivIVA domain-containing protein [Lachnospiraceae bacterium]
MITPIEIQNKVFKSGGLGYDKKDVDSFMEELLDDYEALYRERMEMNDRINVLNEGLQYYKTIEKTLQKALVLAERTAEETKSTALKNALLIEQEAVSKANVILEDAKRELDQIRKQTVELVRQYDMYKAKFKSLVNSQLELLESQSFSVNLDQLSMFDAVPEAVDTPVGLYNEKADEMKENPLDALPKDDIEIIDLDEE